MFKKVLSLVLALVLCFCVTAALASCGEDTKKEKDPSEAPLAAVSLGEKFTVPSDFKVGFIFLHDENSTYDLNFINAANKIKAHLCLTYEHVIFEKNIEEEGTA